MLTIKNDTGGVLGTKLLNDDGDDICPMMGVEAIAISMPSANAIIQATITIGLVKTELKTGEVEWIAMNPQSRKYEKVESIVFANGARLNFDPDGSIFHYPDGGITKVLPIGDGRTLKFRSARE